MLEMLLNATPSTFWAALAGMTGLAGVIGTRLLRGIVHRDAREHIVRLAKTIVEIEKTFEADLAHIGQTTLFARFPKECRDRSRRAHNALAAREQLGRRRAHVLKATLMLLHEDHRRLVELRMELDSALAVWENCQASLQKGAAATGAGQLKPVLSEGSSATPAAGPSSCT